MRCSTCGETLRLDEDRCPTCGAAVSSRAVSVPRQTVEQCPRCAYRGGGVPYFRRLGHVGLLVGLSFFTWGIGGLVYWAARRRHRVCPSCGLGWEHARGPGPPRLAEPARAPAPVDRHVPLPPSGIGRRVIGAGLALLATLMITVGIVELTAPAIAVGAVFGMAGSATFLWGWKALQERRHMVLQSLNRKVLVLAGERGGILTVTEVATELNLSIPAAEKLLIAMDDGFRVRSDISDEGVLYFEFPELLHQGKLRAGDPA